MTKLINPFAKKLYEVTDSPENFIDPRQYKALDNDYYGKTARIQRMSPEQYFREAGSAFAYKDEGMNSSVNRARVMDYVEQAKQGAKFPLPWLEYNQGKLKGHDGRHRAKMADELGLEEIDVVVIE